MQADSIVRVLGVAERARIPVVGFIESAGARLQEGVAALSGYGRIFRAHTLLSGVVPQISVICGASAGGGSYAPALTDFVVMTQKASMFLTGPGVVREVTGEDVDAATLGGPKVHDRNGVCQLVARDDVDAAWTVRDLLDHLPQHAGVAPTRWPTLEPGGERPDAPVPTEDRKVYDVRDVARLLVDGGRLLEVSPRWARNIFTGFARIDGRSVGVIANNPRYLGGVLDADVGDQGREVRPDLRPVRDPARRPGRHARVPARHAPGGRRRDPPRRQARARVRRRARYPDHRGPAQGVRRGVHRDELARPRRGPRAGAGRARRSA